MSLHLIPYIARIFTDVTRAYFHGINPYTPRMWEQHGISLLFSSLQEILPLWRILHDSDGTSATSTPQGYPLLNYMQFGRLQDVLRHISASFHVLRNSASWTQGAQRRTLRYRVLSSPELTDRERSNGSPVYPNRQGHLPKSRSGNSTAGWVEGRMYRVVRRVVHKGVGRPFVRSTDPPKNWKNVKTGGKERGKKGKMPDK